MYSVLCGKYTWQLTAFSINRCVIYGPLSSSDSFSPTGCETLTLWEIRDVCKKAEICVKENYISMWKDRYTCERPIHTYNGKALCER